MTELVINIGILETLAIIIAGAGTLIGLAWYGASRLTRVETLVETMDRRITTIEGNASGAISTQSPIELTEKGKELLSQSGLRRYVDESVDELVRLATPQEETLETAYDVQDAAFTFFEDVTFDKSFENKLKEYAYQNGISLQLLRRIAGIYLRDRMLERLSRREENSAA